MSDMTPWQCEIFEQALRAHETGKLGHGLLLSGPANMGKNEVALALAKRLLCERATGLQRACGSCRACTFFAAGTHGDATTVTLEFNEKTEKQRNEISVDQIRHLSEWMALTPQHGGSRVATITPAELLNTASANALLKTLEEPTLGRYLLLVSSNPGRLPATLRSRCQSLVFRLPDHAQAIQWLLSQGTKPEDAEQALQAAQGHPGLAQKWLNEGGLSLRQQVQQDLVKLARGQADVMALAQAWLGDEQGELRLRFAADIALERMRKHALQAHSQPALAVAAWFEAINRCREQLRAPLRHDLALVGLLRDWVNISSSGR